MAVSRLAQAWGIVRQNSQLMSGPGWVFSLEWGHYSHAYHELCLQEWGQAGLI